MRPPCCADAKTAQVTSCPYLAVLSDHDVVAVTVANPQHIGGHTVSRAGECKFLNGGVQRITMQEGGSQRGEVKRKVGNGVGPRPMREQARYSPQLSPRILGLQPVQQRVLVEGSSGCHVALVELDIGNGVRLHDHFDQPRLVARGQAAVRRHP